MTAPEPRPAHRAWPIALAILPVLAAVLWLGNDASWDLRNYHLYGPHALLHGRAAIDIAPAQLQGYHNPLLDLPMYLLARAGAHPKLIGLLLALPAMFSLWCLLRLQEVLSPAPPTLASRVFLVLLALTGAATWSTLGTAMDDAFLAAGMLGALLLLLHRQMLAAGLLAGATAGLKLAGAFYCPALGLAVLVLPGTARERMQRLLLLAAGGLLGLLLSYGWWGWGLWQAHGNPFFPYFNDLFHAPDIAAQSWLDLRFRPQGPLDLLLAPVHLLARSQRFSEAGLKDPRLLLALIGFASLAWSTRSAQLRMLCAFVVAAALAWALQSGIYRYAIALELLGALALALLLARVPRLQGLALLLAFALVSADTRRPDWQRVADSGPLVSRAPLPPDALVVTASGEPLGYLVLALPDEVPMLGLNNNFIRPDDCHALPRAAARRVAGHRGPIFLATLGEPGDQAFLTETYGLESAGPCQALESRIGDALLCPQRRTSGKIHRWNFHTGTSCAS